MVNFKRTSCQKETISAVLSLIIYINRFIGWWFQDNSQTILILRFSLFWSLWTLLLQYLKIHVFLHFEQLSGYDVPNLFCHITFFFDKEFICYTVFIFLDSILSYIFLLMFFCVQSCFCNTVLKLVFKLNPKCMW